eukprot:COSAG02_NODE_208_length_29027_cov_27.870230_9_plen_140_part_00
MRVRVGVKKIDNALFAIGTAERVRARVEIAGRVKIGDEESIKLARKKWLHVVAVTVSVLVGVHTSVWASQNRKQPLFAGVWLTTTIVCVGTTVIEELWANNLDPNCTVHWRSVGVGVVLSVLGANLAMIFSLIVFNFAS